MGIVVKIHVPIHSLDDVPFVLLAVLKLDLN